MKDKNTDIKKVLEGFLDRSEDGEWFEPNITNKDLIYILSITLIGSGMIIFGCYIS